MRTITTIFLTFTLVVIAGCGDGESPAKDASATDKGADKSGDKGAGAAKVAVTVYDSRGETKLDDALATKGGDAVLALVNRIGPVWQRGAGGFDAEIKPRIDEMLKTKSDKHHYIHIVYPTPHRAELGYVRNNEQHSRKVTFSEVYVEVVRGNGFPSYVLLNAGGDELWMADKNDSPDEFDAWLKEAGLWE